MLEDIDKTAHLDGFRASMEDEGGRLRVRIHLYAGGVPLDHTYFPELRLFDEPKTQLTEAAQERIMIVAQAMCTFLNSGGQSRDLWLLMDTFCSSAPGLTAPYQLVSVLPPQGGVMMVWRKPDGSYLKVVDGEEGFTETLTEKELKESFQEQLQEESPESSWP